MKISDGYKRIITEEFRYAQKMMQSTEDPEQKLFYYSSTYGILARIFNLQYDSQLVFAHFVLNNSYSSINARIKAIKSGDRVIDFPPEFFVKLGEAVEEFADKFEKNQSIYEVLQRIAELSFVSTGNGFYLLQKGTLKI